tara:strand:+ start:1285 stop:1476 length:192 start_codon:yes stop_codon:yes gene_type:complete
MNTDLVDSIVTGITETYLQIMDQCRWQQYYNAEISLAQLANQVDDLRQALAGFDSVGFDSTPF